MRTLWDQVIEQGDKYGFRNAQVTLLAPTGTIGLMMGCDTTGVEPAFMLVVYKKLHGGGYMKLVDDSDPIAILYSLNEILVTGWSVVNDASS